MEDLKTRLKAANSLLKAYAVPLEGTLGRVHPDLEDETRFSFQRDRDRIIHTQAFRRLKGKTQVFVVGQGDHYRTRLTHTMEVAQISRDIARTLQLNEDLAECIALAHDLGHPPFGHAGEEALNTWMEEHDLTFEHNQQSHRIVTLLENHTSLYTGLNLNQEILEGLLKHSTPHDQTTDTDDRRPSLEAQLVNLSDEIAYSAHDCDDGLKAELFTLDDLLQTELTQEARVQGEARGTSLRGSIIHLLVTDLYDATEESLLLQRINTLNNVYAAKENAVCFSKSMASKLDELRGFLWNHMYLNKRVLERSQEGKRCISKLCQRYIETPTSKILELEGKTGGNLAEAAKDYVAGMTDEFAMQSLKEKS